MTRLLVALTIGLVLAAAAVPAAPARPRPPEAGDYFPTTVGARWVYVLNSNQLKESEVVETVVAVEPLAGGAKVVTVGRVFEGGQTHPTAKYEVSSRGLVYKANLVGGSGLFREWHQLKLPRRTGQSWKMMDLVGTNWQVDRGVDRVRVPAGEFDAVRVEQVESRFSTTPLQTFWYARGIGRVKAVSGSSAIVLKSFTPNP